MLAVRCKVCSCVSSLIIAAICVSVASEKMLIKLPLSLTLVLEVKTLDAKPQISVFLGD